MMRLKKIYAHFCWLIAYRASKFIMLFSFLLIIVLFFKELGDQIRRSKSMMMMDRDVKYVRYVCTDPFVLFKPRECGGWADRLKGILSTYALAMLLNRTFVIESTHPCELSQMLAPNKVNWLHNNLNNHSSSFDLDLNYKLEMFEHYASADVLAEFKQLDKFKVINIYTGMRFSDAFAWNPLLRERIAELGIDKAEQFTLYHQMYKWYGELFKLAPGVVDKYDRLYARVKPKRDTFLICLQIRVGQQTNQANRPDARFMSGKGELEKFWTLLDTEFVSKMGRSDNYRIFVTSDHDDVKWEAEKLFGKEKIVYNADSSVHIDRDISDKQSNCEKVDSVAVEFHLMSSCDAMLVSHSGYGILAAWNRPNKEKNLYILTKRNQSDLRKLYWDRSDLEFKKVIDFPNEIFFI